MQEIKWGKDVGSEWAPGKGSEGVGGTLAKEVMEGLSEYCHLNWVMKRSQTCKDLEKKFWQQEQ